MKLLPDVIGDADPLGGSERRSWLSRRWLKGGPTALVIGINPSTASESRDDQTTRFLDELLRNLSGKYRCGGFVLVNCSDLRASKPKLLSQSPDAFTPGNLALISQKLAECDFVVASWGTTFYGPELEEERSRVADAVEASGKQAICFSPRGLPIHCRRTNKNSRDGRWSDSPVVWRRSSASPNKLSTLASPPPQRRRGSKLITGIASDKPRRIRTKRQISKDIAFVLNVPAMWLSYAAQHAVLRQAMWAWTEIDGKYDGCAIWSEAAWKIRRTAAKGDLIHEHAVPRSIVIGMLRQLAARHLGSVTTPMVMRICRRYLHGVVVTSEEDRALSKAGWRSRMPPEFGDPASDDYQDVFLRYGRCGIDLRKVAVN